ncbi:MAG TPA: antibiotic biosynthesis monooxygenase family protein [Chloroflexia bacterium]|nr:antibiotic biosynthesis monooxygenase family protein [Chloroflexia bacterium]
MYGTVARMRIKPGMEAQADAYMTRITASQIPGNVATYMYRMDANPNEFYMATIFESKDAYFANANAPEQNARYEEMLSFLDGPPEWHDGEVVYTQGG